MYYVQNLKNSKESISDCNHGDHAFFSIDHFELGIKSTKIVSRILDAVDRCWSLQNHLISSENNLKYFLHIIFQQA